MGKLILALILAVAKMLTIAATIHIRGGMQSYVIGILLIFFLWREFAEEMDECYKSKQFLKMSIYTLCIFAVFGLTILPNLLLPIPNTHYSIWIHVIVVALQIIIVVGGTLGSFAFVHYMFTPPKDNNTATHLTYKNNTPQKDNNTATHLAYKNNTPQKGGNRNVMPLNYKNYRLLLVGLAVIILGFILMSAVL